MMMPSIWLRESRTRFLTHPTLTLAEALQGRVEYQVYLRSLFHLKRAVGCDPTETLHRFMRTPGEPINPDAAFYVAIAAAEAQERA